MGLEDSLFLFFHRDLANPLFDLIFPNITDLHRNGVVTFFILPALLIFWGYKKRRQAIGQILLLLFTVALTDAFSHHVVKKSFERPRPRHAGIDVQLKTRPHAGYSFTSNHAANNFAAAYTLSRFFPAARAGLFFFATLVAFSRVYVGVHYPSDIVGGALLGLTLAWILFNLVEKIKTVKRGARE